MQNFATVLMPTYNNELHVEEAVLSILGQTMDDFELLIVDDGSVDRTLQIVNSFSDPRVRVVRFNQNRGVSHVLNDGISMSNSKYVVRMDADDVSVPHRLATQLRYMEEHPDVGLCGSHVVSFGDYTCTFAYPTDHEQLKVMLLSCNPIAHPSVVLRRNAFTGDVLRYRNRYKYCEDYDLWARCAQRCRIANIPEVLVRYRVHDAQVSHLFARMQSVSAARVRLRQAEILCDGLTSTERRAYASIIEGRTMLSDDVRGQAEALKGKLLEKNAAKGMYNRSMLMAALENPCLMPPILEVCEQ